MKVHGFALPQFLAASLYSGLDATSLFRMNSIHKDFNFQLQLQKKSIFKIVRNSDSAPSNSYEHPSMFTKAEENDLKVKVEAEDKEIKSSSLPISNMSKKILKKPIFTCIRMSKVQNTKRFPSQIKKRATWQASEDELLLELMKEHGTRWSQIAVHMDGRNGKQVRDRYLNVLKPGRNKARWSKKEDQTLLKQYSIWGHKWCQIAKTLPGRTEIQVKNRYYTCLKKRVSDNELGLESLNIEPKIEVKMEAEIEKNIESHIKPNLDSKIEGCVNLKLEGIAIVKHEICRYPNKFQAQEEMGLHESMKSEETTD